MQVLKQGMLWVCARLWVLKRIQAHALPFLVARVFVQGKAP